MAALDTLYSGFLMGLILALAWFDFESLRIPNRVTFLLLITGLLLHLPGAPELWFISILLLTSWYFGWMGGGDAKLWLALVWLVPGKLQGNVPLAFGLVFLVTGLAQLLWRVARQRQLTGVSAPGAWRVIPFAAWMLWMG